MPDQLPIFETHLKERGRTWKWYVCTTEGDVVVQGAESRRRAATYNANRALLLSCCRRPIGPYDAVNGSRAATSRAGAARPVERSGTRSPARCPRLVQTRADAAGGLAIGAEGALARKPSRRASRRRSRHPPTFSPAQPAAVAPRTGGGGLRRRRG